MAVSRRFCRSRKDRVLCGICGGLGKYFNVDSNIVRLITIVISLFAPILILGYVIVCLIIPEEDEKGECKTYAPSFTTEPAKSVLIILGLVFIFVGVLFMLFIIAAIIASLSSIRIRENIVVLVVASIVLLAIGLILIERSRHSITQPQSNHL
ncbi:MAG: PspC domain-containing protein [Ignisphaera sp.]